MIGRRHTMLGGGDVTALHIDCGDGYSSPHSKISRNRTRVSARRRMHIKAGAISIVHLS